MTAISEIESVAPRRTSTRSVPVHDPLSTFPPPPWATPAVDRFICAMDACDLEAIEIIQQIKAQFPRLAKCVISEETLTRRLMILDRRVEMDYFKDAQSFINSKQKNKGRWQEVKNGPKTQVPEDTISMPLDHVHTGKGKASMNKEEGDGQAQATDKGMGPHVTTKLARRHSKIRAVETVEDRRPANVLVTVDEEENEYAFRLGIEDPMIGRVGDTRIEDADHHDPADLVEDELGEDGNVAIKHGLAIHKDHGEAWEELRGDGLAWAKSVRRINPNGQEDAKRRAIKHGMAIHQSHGETWENFKSGLGYLRSRSKSIKGAKEDVGRASPDEENFLPVPLKSNGEVVGIAPGGVLKTLG